MKKLISYIVLFGILWLIVCAIRPYWNQNRIESDMNAAALYGTKHSIEDTRKLLTEKLSKRGYDFGPEQLSIEKDENKTVRIRLTYEDEISFFGFILKELEFTLDLKVRETKEVL